MTGTSVIQQRKKNCFTRRKNAIYWHLPLFIVLALSSIFTDRVLSSNVVRANSSSSAPAVQKNDDWTSFAYDDSHSGFNNHETGLTVKTVPKLKRKWFQFAAGGVSTQPIVAGHVVYWGSWDGYEHAFTTAGAHIWDAYLGSTGVSTCIPPSAGVASTATLGRIGPTPVIFVGGGNATFYALNANTGKVIWSTVLGPQNTHFIWDSPVLHQGSIFIGVSSFGDCPLVQGKFFKLDAATGQIQKTLNIVPDGCIGGGIWGSPSISASGTIYVPTGTYNACSTGEPLAAAILQLRASDLSLLSSWQLPLSEISTLDLEFGATPTLMDITFGKVTRHYLGIASKDGYYYTFDRLRLAAGPVWKNKIANDANQCPQCDSGSISPSAWDGKRIYAAGGNATIAGTNCPGSIQAINPVTGSFIWQRCLSGGPVLGAVTAIQGVVMVTHGTTLDMLNAATGSTIFTFNDTQNASIFYGSPSVAHGMVFVGNMDGNLYTFGL